MFVVPEKALVLATTKCMLYGEDPLYVGVGLMYKPHYISMESFCATYMHLNVWHAAGSSADSVDKLDSSRFILVTVSEMSDVIQLRHCIPSSWTWQSRRPWKELENPWLPLVLRLQAPHCMELATWRGSGPSGLFSSSPRGGHHTHAGV